MDLRLGKFWEKYVFMNAASIDDYAKMADQGRSDVCVVFTMSLCALELKQTVISLLFQVKRL